METAVRARVEEVWAKRLGCAVSLLRTPGIHPVDHPQPAALYAVLVGEGAIVAAPREMHGALRDLAAEAIDAKALASLVPGGATWIGPAFVGYTTSRPAPPPVEVAIVALADLDPVRRAVSSTEWTHGNLEAASPLFAAFADGTLASAAGGQRLPGDVAHLGVVTHPAYRGRGLGRAVVASALAHALDEGSLAQFQTLYSNRGAMSIARALGFEHFATTLAARWHRDTAPECLDG